MQQSLFSSSPQQLALPNAELHYYPDFIQGQRQQVLYQTLLNTLDWQQDTLQLYGRPVLIPRMNAWYGDDDARYSYSGLNLAPLPWTPCLLTLKHSLEQFLHTSFNSVLANYYRNGKDSVAWHSDDEPELGSEPLIASLSFGATRRFSLRSKVDKQLAPVHIDLSSGSLLVMSGATQRCWHHQLPKTTKPVTGRINLTFRTVITKGPKKYETPATVVHCSKTL